jgi:hypothetical protein
MDKRNKGRIDKQPFIKHYGTQETNDRATRTTIKKLEAQPAEPLVLLF